MSRSPVWAAFSWPAVFFRVSLYVPACRAIVSVAVPVSALAAMIALRRLLMPVALLSVNTEGANVEGTIRSSKWSRTGITRSERGVRCLVRFFPDDLKESQQRCHIPALLFPFGDPEHAGSPFDFPRLSL